jgi:hypothetical protein
MAEEIPEFAKKLSDDPRKLERARTRLQTAIGNVAKAKKKLEDDKVLLANCERKLRNEQKRVNELERVHNTFELGKEIHLQSSLERGLF